MNKELQQPISPRQCIAVTRGKPARKPSGFTLIELMVVVALVALLLSIAVPGYSAQIRRANRTEAKTALLGVASAQERFLFSFGRYSESLTGAVGNSRVSGLALADTTKSGDDDNAYYDMSLEVEPGGLGYEVSAFPQGSQTVDDCGTLRLTHSGERGADAEGCW